MADDAAHPDGHEALHSASVDPYGLSGKTVSQYLVHEPLGRGGMGVVYRAEDTRLRRTVALKFLPPALSHDLAAKERFLVEAQAASVLDHPNICPVYEFGEAESGQLFLAMPYYRGETLRDKIERGALPVDDALVLVAQVARGLQQAHAASVVHRDIKPANIMVTTDGEAKLVDFGVAKLSDSMLTKTGTQVGTAAYMSPEQARGEAVDQQTDIWSLGVVLYEALTGTRPFAAAYEQAVIFGILYEEPKPVTQHSPEVPAEVEAIVERCLRKDPAERYPTVAELLADVQAVQKGERLQNPKPQFERATRVEDGPTASPSPPARSGLSIILGASVVALVMLVAAVFLVRRGASADESGRNPAGVQQMAVLPFANVGNDPANQAFIDGLAYTVSATLAELETLGDRLSILPVSDVLEAGVRTPQAAADALRADLAVDGSVQRAADRVRLTLALHDAQAGRPLRSQIIDTETTDLLALQDSVALKLAELLDLELNPAEQRTLTAGGTTSPGAFDFYTQARGYLQHYEDERNVDNAIRLFEQAVEEDAAYALAWAGLGEAYWRKYEATSDPQWVDKASEAGERAVELEENLAPVRVALGMIYKGTGRYEEAERELRRALELDESNAVAHQQLAASLYYLGQEDEAEVEYKRAIALKPGYWAFYNNLGNLYRQHGREQDAIEQYRRVVALRPDNPWGYNNIGASYFNLSNLDSALVWYRRAVGVNPAATGPTALAYRNLGDIHAERQEYDQAVSLYRQAVALDSTESDHWYFLGNAYYQAGQRAEAEQAWERMIALDERAVRINPNDEDGLLGLAYGYAWTGRPEEAREPLRRLVALPQKQLLNYRVIATIYDRLGERAAALNSLAEAMEKGLTPEEIERSPWLDALRSDPRYDRLIQDHTSR